MQIVFSAHGVTFVKYASVLLQVLQIQVDEDFLFALLDLTKVKGVSWEEEQAEYDSSKFLTILIFNRS
jgi:hypothetical protein